MTSQTSPVASQNTPSPEPIFDLATGFMRAKHLFIAGELGIFEQLALGPATLEELAARLGTPRRTTRIIVDAVTALGLLERLGDKYRNGEVAQAYLSGRGPADMRPFIRFWNRLSYKRWLTLEDSVRQGQGVAGEFNFTAEEQKIFSEDNTTPATRLPRAHARQRLGGHRIKIPTFNSGQLSTVDPR
jgi:hypothetical protein